MKAAIYSRKSKFKEEGESIENQIKMCIEYAEKNLGITEYDIYEDEGFSGKNTDRPNFQKMMRKIENKEYSHFICYRLDRAFRNVADYSHNMNVFNQYNTDFISIKEQFDTTTAMGRAMMNVSATFAQLERETTAERIRDNLKELSKTGRWLGGPAPLGYESIEVENNDLRGKSRKKHILQIVENNANIVKLVYQLFIKHKSFQGVSLTLERQGIYSRKGSLFSRDLVKQIINSPVYVIADNTVIDFFKENNCEIYISNTLNGLNGIMPYNRRKENGSYAPINDWIIAIGEHPGIISSSDWIECQNICKEIKLKASNRQCTSQNALLSGLVICGHCGSGMAPKKHIYKAANGDKGMYRYYSCNLKNKSGTRCDNISLNAYDAEDYVVNKIKNITKAEILDIYLDSKHKATIKTNNSALINSLKKQIEDNKKTLSSLSRKVAKLDEDNDDDKEIISTYEDEIKAIRKENKKLEEQIIKLESENENILDVKKDISKIFELYDNFKKFYDFTEDFDDKKRLIASVVKFVVWDSDANKLELIPVGSNLTRKDYG